MCLALYLFTDSKLAQSPWQPGDPKFFIEAVNNTHNDRGALAWTTSCAHLYYMGSYQGCGCGWAAVTDWDTDYDRSKKLQDRCELMRILKTTDLATSSLICCWEGAQGEPVRERHFVSPAHIEDGSLEFEELHEYLIRHQ